MNKIQKSLATIVLSTSIASCGQSQMDDMTSYSFKGFINGEFIDCFNRAERFGKMEIYTYWCGILMGQK